MSIQKSAQILFKTLSIYTGRHSMILSDKNRPCEKNKVNLHYWRMGKSETLQNLGDYLSPVVVEYVKKEKGLYDAGLSKTRHLYGIGSILGNGYQNATVWGSGFMNDPAGSRLSAIMHSRCLRKLDVRAVRGPLTRQALLKLGHQCPQVYGDPALLMPLIYTPKPGQMRPVSVIRHFTDRSVKDERDLEIVTTDYPGFLDQLAGSRLVVSSSLHGIILAESYGVPAVLYLPKTEGNDGLTLYKYRDYYFGTGRETFPVASTIEEAMTLTPCPIPDFSPWREKLLEAFPTDLWEL